MLYKKEIVQLLEKSMSARVIGVEKWDSTKDDNLVALAGMGAKSQDL